MSVSNLNVKSHCLMGATTIGAGAIAGGVFFSSAVTGAICGVAWHVIDLTAMATGIFDKKSDVDLISRVAVGLFKGLAVQAVLVARGLSFTMTPLAILGFVVLSYGLQLAAVEVIKANKQLVERYI